MAGIPFLHNIDLKDNQLLNAKLHTSGTAPSNPGTGTIWYDSSNSLVKIYDSGWNTISGDITGVTSATTNQLTVANSGGPAPAFSIVTAAIANGGTGLATADQIHTFVTTQTDDIAASTTGTAAIATTVTVADESSDTTCFPLFATAATGNLGPKSGDNLTFNSATGILTATGFAGDITGNVTGNTSGSAGTVTSIGNLTGDVTSVNRATTIAADAVHHGMLNDDIISGQAEYETADLADADELMVSDGGVIKRVGLDTLKDGYFNTVSVANLKTALAGGFGSNAVTIGDSDDVVTIGNDLIITGDLTVSGDTITANVGTLDVEDKNITVNKGSGDTSSTANGAGLTIQDAVDASTDATMLWDASNDEFDFSHAINITGKISTSGTIELGHATDTTLSRASAGDVNIEGNIIYRAGGTDVAIADGGTGASTAAAAFTALKQAATTSATGVVELATTTEASTGTDSSRAVTADGLQQFHNDRNKSFELDNSASGVASSDNITYTITHGMGASRLYKVEIIEDATNYETVYAKIQRPSDTTITVAFASAVTAGAYRALITKI